MPKILYLALLVVSLSACKTPLSLSFNMPENAPMKYEIANESNTLTKVMGMDMEVVSKQQIECTMTNTGRTADGGSRVAVEYDEVYSLTETPQGTDEYDSRLSDEAQDSPQAAMYRAMLGEPFYISYTADGNISDVEGLDELFDKMFGSYPPEARAGMEAIMNESTFTEAFKNMTLFYPPKPVKPGESWQVDNSFAMGGMELELEHTYTLTKRENGMATISVEGVIFTAEDSPGMEMMGMTMHYDLEGTQTGTIIVDEASGWIDQSTTTSIMGGTMTMTGMGVDNMSVDMQVNASNEMRRKEE